METLNTLTNSKGQPAFKDVIFNALNEVWIVEVHLQMHDQVPIL